MTNKLICEVDGCSKPMRHRQWCAAHYKRWYRHGDPAGGAGIHYTNPRDAFSARTVKDDVTGCLLWTGSSDGKKYGHIRIKGKLVKAHRYAWQLANGDIPSGLFVLHICDNPQCVNVGHLFIGTQLDNVRDMDAKGRRVNNQPRGEKCHAAKLTIDDVISIRNDNRRQIDIAAQYGVKQGNVSKIKSKQAWGHVS
jgi:HNH endonuclease